MKKSNGKMRLLAMTLCACMLTAMIPTTGSAPAQALEDNNSSSSENYGGLTAQDYKDFGLSITDPAAFSSDENPLADYQPSSMSQLYVGYTNKGAGEAHKGYYAVYDTMKMRGENAATINDPNNSKSTKNGTLQNDPVSPLSVYNGISDSRLDKAGTGQQALNAITVKTGNPGETDLIAESLIFTAPASSSKLVQSWLMIRLKAKQNGAYRDVNHLIFPISDSTNGSKADVFKSLDAQAKMALTALATGDFDGDGKTEIAAYIPSISHSTAPYVAILDVDNGTLSDSGKKIQLSDLNADGSAQYNYGFGDTCNAPVVSLTTTTLAGRDDLAISVSLPRGNINGSGNLSQEPALGIYTWENGSPKRVFLDHLSYSEGYMRFPSTVVADVNATGQKELVIAGYADTWDGGSSALPAFSQYFVNMLLYEDGHYQMQFANPLTLSPSNTANLSAAGSFPMGPPLALSAAKLSDAHKYDYLFVGGCIASFQPADNPRKDMGEFGLLEKGSLERLYDMDISGYVSQAVTGNFAVDHQKSQQIAVVWEKRSKSSMDSNIAWVWMENNKITQHNTNTQYIHGRDATKSGTFLTLCRVDDTVNASQIRYKGKSYGWSKPTPLVVMPATPYWEEIGNPGEVSYRVSNEYSAGGSADLSLSMGVTGGFSAMGGAAFAGNKVQFGGGMDFEAMLTLAASIQAKFSVANSMEVSAPGDVNRVVVYATPVVIYEYEYWLPAFTVDQAYIDEYKTLTGEDCPYDSGVIVAAHWETYHQAVPYSSVFSMMSMDSYLSAWTKHAGAGSNSFDTSALDVYTPGDPSQYPENFDDIPYYPSVPTRLLSHPVTVSNDQNDYTFAFDAGASLDLDLSASVEFSGSLLVKGAFEVELVGSVSGEGQIGLKGGTDEGLGVNLGASIGAGVTGSVKSLPDDAGDYSYETTMGIWPCAGSGALLTTGYTVETPADVPPLLPQHANVMGGTSSSALLCWDEPGEYRRAEAFDVFYRKTGETAYTKFATVNADERNNLLVTGLTANTSYDFAFQAKAGSLTSVMSKPVTFKTSSGEFILDSPQTVIVEEGNPASFTVAVKAVGIGADSSHTFQYQWEKLNPDTKEWEPIPGAEKATYTIASVTADLDSTKYRAVVTSYPKNLGSSIPDGAAYSLPATLYLKSNDSDTTVYNLNADVSSADGKPFGLYNGVYYGAENQEVTISGQLYNKDGGPLSYPGDFTLYGRTGNGPFEEIARSEFSNYQFTSDPITLPAGVSTYYLQFHINLDNVDRTYLSAPMVINAGAVKNNFWQVDYQLDSGVNHPDNPHFVGKNAGNKTLQDPTRDYCKFEGWYTDPDFANKVTELVPQEMTEDITLYAKWKPIEYGIYYNSVVGDQPKDQYYTYTMFETVRPKDPTRPGYRFTGWYPNQICIDGTQITEVPGKLGPGDVYLWTKWELIHYPIVYQNTRGIDTSDKSKFPATYSVGVDITPSKLQDLPHLSFVGWFDDDGNEVTTIYSQSRTGPLTLTAKWEQKNYLLAYRTNGGTPVAPELVAPGETRDLRDATTQKTGYLFDGWFENPELTTPAQPADNYKVDSNKLLYAKWNQNPDAHTVTFDSQGGDLVNEALVDPDTPVEEPIEPTRTGYTFTGWYLEDTCENLWNFQDNVTQDMTLYAGWEDTVLTVTFDTGIPKTIDPVTVNWGKTISEPQVSRDNYKITGWYLDDEYLVPWDFSTPVYEDTTLYAK